MLVVALVVVVAVAIGLGVGLGVGLKKTGGGGGGRDGGLCVSRCLPSCHGSVMIPIPALLRLSWACKKGVR